MTTESVPVTAVDTELTPVVMDTDMAEPSFPALKVVESDDPQYRKILIPSHRLSPLRAAWMKIYTPLVEILKLQIRFNPKGRAVEIRTSQHTVETGALQKAADFVRAFSLGFDVDVRSPLLYPIYLPSLVIVGLDGTAAPGGHVRGLF